MNVFKFIYLLFASLFITISAKAYIDTEHANIAIMNKAAGKTKNIYTLVGKQIEFDNRLLIMVRSCKLSDPFKPANAYMFIEITDKSTKNKLFSGWMNKNAPGFNPLQHPDYDLWLINCE